MSVRADLQQNDGVGRALAAAYTVLAIAAGARALVQLSTHPDDAPFAYALSAVAAAIYLAGAILLRRPGERARRAAIAVCSVELAGVLFVGALSLVRPSAFPDATVWSNFGLGYGFVPLVLPVLALLWLVGRKPA